MNQFIDYLIGNQWTFLAMAVVTVLVALLVLKDLVFGIHWIRDILIPALIIGFYVLVYVSA